MPPSFLMRWLASNSNSCANAKSTKVPSPESTYNNGLINPLNGEADTIA